jgi:hypothetical protein
LHAINLHGQNLDVGPWHLGCDLGDIDTAKRLKTRFRAAARNAAMALGAPDRVNRLDWWISKLARGRPMGSLQGLIQRSVEYCEELENTTIELGLAPTRPAGLGGLYRDRYPCDWDEFYVLYAGPHCSFSDPKAEFEYWTEHIWSGFNEEIARLDERYDRRKRQGNETREELKDRIRRRVVALCGFMKRWIRGLSYDLAVLQANYIIDCGPRGDAAMRTFQDQSVGLVESVRRFGHEISKRLGLSYRKLEKEGVDPAKPFAEVAEDLRRLMLAMPAEAPSGIPEHAVVGVSGPLAPAAKYAGITAHEAGPRKTRKAKNPERRNQKYRVIDEVLKELAESRPSTQEEVFQSLEARHVVVPPAEPFMAARGWLAGFRQHPGAARAWLSKRWAELNLATLPRGPKK